MRESIVSGITAAVPWIAVRMVMPIFTLMSGGSVQAQEPPVRFEISPAVGGIFFASDLPASFQLDDGTGGTTTLSGVVLDDALTFGGGAGVRIAERFGIGASLLYTPITYSTSSATGQEGGLFTYGADLSYHAVGLAERATPFVVAGIGAKSYDFEGADWENDFMWNVGVGADVAIAPSVALRLEARDYMSLFDPEMDGFDEELQHDIALTAGLSFSFGPPRGTSARRGAARW